ncbi:MAG: rubredoxin [bacterium]|nr:rubredoxin [bacterium]
MKCYICRFCSYEYDPKEGDLKNKIPKKTTFEDLPDSWKCPMCLAPKTDFFETEYNNF